MQAHETTALISIIRRTLRIIGSQPSHASFPVTTAAVARLVYSRLSRGGVPVEWVEGEHGTPLVIAGTGPIALSAFLDDLHPDSARSTTEVLDVQDTQVAGSGLERKAATVAHMATLLADPTLAERVTIVFETDRHAGSHTLEHWLAANSSRFSVVGWEVTDLPLKAPAIVRAATGTLILEVRLDARRSMVEPVYGTVLPDIGLTMANLLVSLKSADEEVRIEGFYDGISSLESADIDAVSSLGPGVSRWLGRVAGDERNLSTSHLTLGMFWAPSLVVRRMSVDATGDYLPEGASAIVEFQMVPGQDVGQVIGAVRSHVESFPFAPQVTPLLTRAPVAPVADIELDADLPIIPIAPGPSPASVFAGHGISGMGYALVSRQVTHDDGIQFESIAAGSVFLNRIIEALSAHADCQP